METLPTIRIAVGDFLTPMFNAYVRETKSEPGIGLEKATENIEESVTAQRNQWLREESDVLKGITEATHLTFQESVIPVYVVPAYRGAFSDPIVISSLQQKMFSDILAHELIHRIGEYNNEKVSASEVSKTLFPEFNGRKITNHIYVHTIHHYIYSDILNNTDRLEAMIEKHSQWPEYKKAWEVVQERGYRQLIEQYREVFKASMVALPYDY